MGGKVVYLTHEVPTSMSIHLMPNKIMHIKPFCMISMTEKERVNYNNEFSIKSQRRHRDISSPSSSSEWWSIKTFSCCLPKDCDWDFSLAHAIASSIETASAVPSW